MAVIFYTAALVALVASFMVIIQRNPGYSVLYIVLCFFALAVIYLILSAPFVAALQIIIYAGGIIVLFLIVIMMISLDRIGDEKGGKIHIIVALTVGGLLLLEAVYALYATHYREEGFGGLIETMGPAEVGRALFMDYSLVVEIASVLLLVAMVGALYLARRVK
ncbi:MAG: NADH-quinone oxidoreductase subunit J family protein [Planctomycetota bacterium]